MAAAEGMELSLSKETSRTTLRNGDFISLFAEAGEQPAQGYLAQETFATNFLTVSKAPTPHASPPNFQQSCIFQLFVANEEAQPGETVNYGDRVVLLHRASQKFVTKSKSAVEAGFNAYLETITPFPPYVKGIAVGDTDDGDADDVGPSEGKASTFPLSALFQLTPRFKVNNQGDPVRLTDQILFESCESTSNSKWYLTSLPHENILFTANKTTGVRTRLFAPFGVSHEAFRHVVKGGDFVRLFHQEGNGFLAVCNADDQYGFSDSGQLGVYVRVLSDMQDQSDIHDAGTVWQIELENTFQAGGRPVQWSDRIRLRNLLTGHYISVNGTTIDPRPDDVLMALEEVGRREDAKKVAMPFRANFYIGSASQNTWLHVEAVNETVGEPLKSKKEGTSTDTELLAVKYQPARFDDDAICIIPVDLLDIRDFFLAEAQRRSLLLLRKYRYNTISESNPDYKVIKGALRELILFCTNDDPHKPTLEHDGEGIPSHQIILLDLDIDTMVMDFCYTMFDTTRGCDGWADGLQHADIPKFEAFNLLGLDIMRLLRQMSKDNSQVGTHLARKYRDRLTKMCLWLAFISEVTWNVADAVEMFYCNNESLLQEVKADFVDQWIDMMYKGTLLKDVYQYLSLLTSLCMNGNKAVPEAQDTVRRCLFSANMVLPKLSVSERGQVLIETRFEDVHKINCAFLDWKIVKMPLGEFLTPHQNDGNLMHDADSNASYFEVVLNILAALCKGRNQDSQKQVRERYINVPILLACLQDQTIPYSARAAIGHVFLYVFVDSDPLEDQTLLHSRSWARLDDPRALERAREEIRKLLGTVTTRDGRFEGQTVLLDWVEKYFQENEGSLLMLVREKAYRKATDPKKGKVVHLSREEKEKFLKDIKEEQGRNLMTYRLLQVVESMVRFGFYHNPERGKGRRELLFRVLLNMLRNSAGRTGHNDTAAHKVVMKGKMLACDTLANLLIYELKTKMTAVLLNFQNQMNSLPPKGRSHIPSTPNEHLTHMFSNETENTAAFMWFTRYGCSVDDFCETVLDLCAYEYDKLRLSALNLLVRTFSFRADLIQMVKDVRIVADYSEDEFKEAAAKDVHALEDLSESEGGAKDTMRVMEIVDKLARSCISEEQLKVFATKLEAAAVAAGKRKAGGGAEVVLADADRIPLRITDVMPLEVLRRYLDWTSPTTDMIMNRSHQGILRELKGHEAVLDYLKEHLQLKDEAVMSEELAQPNVRDMYKACFRFVRLWCQQDVRNKVLLAKKEFKFISKCCKLGVAAAEALYRILKDNPAAYDMNRNVTEKVVMVHAENFITRAQCRSASYLRLLEMLITRKGRPDVSKVKALFNKFTDKRAADKRDRKLFLYNRLPDFDYSRGEVAPKGMAGRYRKFNTGADYSGGRFIEFIVSTFDADQAVTIDDIRQQEYYLGVIRLLSVCCETDDEMIRNKVRKDIPLAAAVLPLISPNPVPLEVKSMFVKFLLEAYFPFERNAVGGKTMATSDDLPLRELVAIKGTLLEQSTLILRSLAEDLGRLQTLLPHNDRKTKKFIDPYIFKRTMPLVCSVLHYINKDLSFMQDELPQYLEAFVAAARQLFDAVRRIIEARRALDEQNPRFYIDLKNREIAAKSLKHLANVQSVDPAIASLVMSEDITLSLTSARDYFGNQRAKEALKSFISEHSHKKHSHSHNHHHHKSHTPSHKGPGTGTGKKTGPSTMGALMPAGQEKPVTATDVIMDEKLNFAKQLLRVLSGPHRGKPIKWMERLAMNIDFKEFWVLVDYVKRELLGASAKALPAAAEGEVGPELEAPTQHRLLRGGSTVSPEQLELREQKKKKKFDIEIALIKIVSHFKRVDAENGVAEDDAMMVAGFLDVLCGLLTEHSGRTKDDILLAAKRLNAINLPLLGLQMSALSFAEPANHALQLCILLLRVSPSENEVLHDLENHPHSQKQFFVCLDDVVGRRVVQSFCDRFEAEVVALTKEEEDDDDDEEQQDRTPEEIMEENRLNSYVIAQTLSLIRLMTLGCYKESQDLLRSCKLIPALANLTSALSSHYGVFIKEDFPLYDDSSLGAVTEILIALVDMMNHAIITKELTSCLGGLVAGPNRENQKDLLNLEICEPLLVCLSFMEYAGSKRSTIDMFREQMVSLLSNWRHLYGIYNSSHGGFAQSSSIMNMGLVVSNLQLSAMAECDRAIKALSSFDRRCEENVLEALFGLMEGRQPGDDAYDTIAQCAFPELSNSNTVAGDVLMNNLRHHYKKTRMLETMVEDAVEAVVAQQAGEQGDDLNQVTLAYFMLAKVLGDESRKWGWRIRRKLKEWEQAESVDLRSQIGRVEIVREKMVQVIYFPIPTVARETRFNPVVHQLEEDVIDSTILLPPEQKIAEFVPKCELVARVIRRQGRVQRTPHLALVSQLPWAWMAFLAVFIINIYTIFDLNNLTDPAIVLGYIHIFLSIMMIWAYSLNLLPIEIEAYAVYENERRPTSATTSRIRNIKRRVQKVLRILAFWSTARINYYLVYLMFSILGVSVSLRFFAFHLFDITLRVKTLGFVIQAIITNILKLGAAFLLLFLLVYSLTLIGQSGFSQGYNFVNGQIECKSLMYCLRDSLYYGYQSAPQYTSSAGNSFLPNFGALFFGLTYFIIVVQIMSAVVSGIIIDSFARLRGEAEQIQTEKDNTCFICSYPRDVLDTASKHRFLGHIKIEHPTWHYAYFLLHLDEKRHSKKNMTGMEIFFLKQRSLRRHAKQEKLVAIMPVKRSLCMEGANASADLDTVHDAVKSQGDATRAEIAALRARIDRLMQGGRE